MVICSHAFTFHSISILIFFLSLFYLFFISMSFACAKINFAEKLKNYCLIRRFEVKTNKHQMKTHFSSDVLTEFRHLQMPCTLLLFLFIENRAKNKRANTYEKSKSNRIESIRRFCSCQNMVPSVSVAKQCAECVYAPEFR